MGGYQAKGLQIALVPGGGSDRTVAHPSAEQEQHYQDLSHTARQQFSLYSFVFYSICTIIFSILPVNMARSDHESGCRGGAMPPMKLPGGGGGPRHQQTCQAGGHVIGRSAGQTGRSSVIAGTAGACHHARQLPLPEWSCDYSTSAMVGILDGVTLERLHIGKFSLHGTPWLSFSPDSCSLILLGGRGEVISWDLQTDDQVSAAHSEPLVPHKLYGWKDDCGCI